jgi:hypothetical protein
LTPATEPRIRHAPIPDDALLVVRGDDLDPETARAQAMGFRRRFPEWRRWGLSAYYARSEAEIEDLAADQLERFPMLVVLKLAELLGAGFEVVPTFRTPHVTIAFQRDLDSALAVLVTLGIDQRPNLYHDREPK